MSTWVIARLTFKEAARRKILLAALVLGVLFLIVYGLGFHFMMQDMERSLRSHTMFEMNEISNFLLMAGLYVVNFLTVMMSVLTSVDTVSGEIASGTIHTLVAKPVRRWEIVLGKWLGFSGMVTLYLLLMAGGTTLAVYLLSGYSPPHIERALALMWLNAILLMSISILGGTIFSTLANGVMVFGLYGIAFIGGWIEQIGSFMPEASAGQTAQNIGVLTSLFLPSEAIWRRAAYEIQSPLVSALGFSPFTAAAAPSLLMILYSVAYLGVAVVLAVRQFKKRDL